MSGTRDPWLAANLSWSVAGLGQCYAGRKISGAIFLGLEILLWAMLASWALSSAIPTIVLAAAALQAILWIVSARSAFVSIPTPEPSPESVKSPWKSVFFTRFIPGAGHLFARKWYRGPLLGLGMLALLVVPFPERFDGWRTIVFFAARALVLMDSYLILRRSDFVPRTTTVAAMLLVLAGSQTWIFPMVLRRFVVEVYKIPSSAMEPTLMGEVSSFHFTTSCPFSADHASPTGDRIVASKLAYLFRPIERFDVAIFRFPLNQSKTFVKRVVGLPNEEIQIHDGDLYVRGPGEQRFRIVRKPLAIQDHGWIRPLYPSTGSPSTALEELFSLSSGIEWPSDERMGSVSGPSGFQDSSGTIAGDVKLSMVFSTGPRSEIAARVKNSRMDLELMLATGGRSRLVLRRPGKEPQELSLELLQTNRTYAYDLIVLDGKVTLRRDSEVVGEIPFIEFIEDAVSRDGWGDLQAFGARGGQTVIRKMEWSCDKHYRGRDREHGWGEKQPLKIPEDSYLFLGDNVPNSHDSRAWVKRTFTLKDGRQIVAEAQMVNEGYSMFNQHLQAKSKKPEPPDIGIDGDQYGSEVGLDQEEIVSQSAEPFRFVHRKFITGRVLKVWWPLERARPVR